MRTLFPRIVLVAALLTSAACSGDGDDGEGAAADNGSDSSVVLYTGRNINLVGPLIEQFSEDTGIDVEVREGGSAELAAQLLTEGGASPADVFLSQDAGALGAVSREGMLEALPTELLDRVPAAYRADDGTWIGTSGRARVIVVNRELVEEPPQAIDDLLDERWKGEIGFAPANASFQAFVTGLRVLRGDDGARSWLESFAAQNPVAYENNIAVRDAVDAGEVEVGLVNHYYLYELIAEVGEEAVSAENVYIGGGDPGGLVNVAGVGVLASAPHREGALELVEYFVGPEGQEYFATETFEYPLVEGAEAAEGLPPLDELEPPEIDLSDLESLQATQEMLAETGLLTM